MKKIIFLSILIVVCSVSFYSCKKNKDPEAVADFTYTLLEHGGVEVTFTGKGSPEWDFGGEGTKLLTSFGSDNTVKFYYKANGNYTIKLTADLVTNLKEKTVSISITGVPTRLKVTEVKLYNFRETNNAGNLWDLDASGPDVTFKYYLLLDGGNLTSMFPNLQKSQLPISNVLSSPLIFDIASVSGVTIYCTDDNSSETIEGVRIDAQYPINNCTGYSCYYNLYPSTMADYNNAGNKTIEVKLQWLP